MRQLRKKLGTSLSLIVLLISFPATSCAADPKAAKLDRKTALTILQKDEGKLLEGYFWELRLADWVFDAAQVGSIQATSSVANYEFCEALAADGILKRKFYREQNPGQKRYEFEAVDSTQVQVINGGTNYAFGNFLIGKSSFSKVTGITQEGPQAVADVEIVTKPTELYEHIDKIVSTLREKYSNPKLSVNWSKWPSVDEINQSKTARVTFRRYDDGWRVVTNSSY